MAERRMFAKTIIDSDAFLDMPLSTQALYFHLSMRADDEGFINNPRKIQRMIGASDDDLRVLIAKNFIIPFESGVVVIKHWKIHNYIRNDRIHDTKYTEEKALLSVKDNGSYTLNADKCQTSVRQLSDTLDTEVRLGKVRLGKDSISCSEPNKLASEPIIFIPLNDGTEYGVTEEMYNEFCTCYPAVDVKQELNKMRAWSLSNPTKKKTKRGVAKFINGWLSKEQDRGGTKKQGNQMSVEEWLNEKE